MNPDELRKKYTKLLGGGIFLAIILADAVPFVINYISMPYIIAGVVLFLFLITLRQINQYQRGVMYTMGRFSGIKEPGWRMVVPIFQSMTKVDMRIKAVDVPDQKAITKDNISVLVNAVIYYRVADSGKAILEVEDFYGATSQLAQTTMRNVVGEVELDQLLSQRDMISERIRSIVDEATEAWGIQVNNVELKDVSLPENMERTIAKQAEAERERRAVIINSEGEVAAAQNIAQAASILAQAPGALHLRTLQAINDVSSDQSNTIVFTLPLEILRAFGKTDK
jgi:regulator of protease activity HflC (stomatin/prohibitin superfamily)